MFWGNIYNMKINYSCVIDAKERYLQQGWLWVNSLLQMGKINPSNIWVHFVAGVDETYIDKFRNTGVNIAVIEPYGDKKYCNKIAQMQNEGLKDSDVIILMDIDMIMLENFENDIDCDYISSKIVNETNPQIEIINELFALSGLKKSISHMAVELDTGITYGANFNGGLYIIPKKYYDIIQSGWEKWAQWLLKSGKPLYEAKKEAHIDQLSFCMTIHENNLPVKYINRLYNYPLPFQFGDSESLPYVLHYHTLMDNNKCTRIEVEYEPIENIKKAIDLANEFIKKIAVE